MRRDALKMEELEAVLNPFAGDPGAQRLARIARLLSHSSAGDETAS